MEILELLFTAFFCFLLVFIINFIASCFNKVKLSNISKIKVGMSVTNVRKILGFPYKFTAGYCNEYIYRFQKTFSVVRLYITFDKNWRVVDYKLFESN
jgi:outer membrane protein assembly factor BamE (lipoprotein component of BamABCDE complex)